MTQAQMDAFLASVDFSIVIGGIASIAGVMAAVYVTWKGAGMIIGALRRL